MAKFSVTCFCRDWKNSVQCFCRDCTSVCLTCVERACAGVSGGWGQQETFCSLFSSSAAVISSVAPSFESVARELRCALRPEVIACGSNPTVTLCFAYWMAIRLVATKCCICLPQPCPTTGRRFAASRSRLNCHWQFSQQCCWWNALKLYSTELARSFDSTLPQEWNPTLP